MSNIAFINTPYRKKLRPFKDRLIGQPISQMLEVKEAIVEKKEDPGFVIETRCRVQQFARRAE